MSVWLEVMCDYRQDADGNFVHECATNNGENPGGLARNPTRIPYALRMIVADARGLGWRRKAGRFCCPACARRLGLVKPAEAGV